MTDRAPHERSANMSGSGVLGACIFVFLCALYLLFYSGTVATSDENVLMSTAESLVKRGEFTANQLYYSRYSVAYSARETSVPTTFEPLQPVLASTLVWLAMHLPHVGIIHLTLFFNVLITALTALAVMYFVIELGYDARIGALCALVYGTCTLAYPYSKQFFREPLAGFLLLMAALSFTRLKTRKNVVYALWCIFFLAGGFLVKEANILALPAFMFVFVGLARSLPISSGSWRRIGLTIVLALLISGGFSAYLASRSDTTGFMGRTLLGLRGFSEHLTAFVAVGQALFGFLLSPGKSFFVFSPIALLSVWGFRRFYRAHRLEAMLIAGVCALTVFGYAIAKSDIWWGGLGWGPRFLVPLAALSVIPMSSLFNDVWQKRSRRQWFVVTGLLLFSFYVQIIGATLDVLVYADGVNQIPNQDRWLHAIWEPQYFPPIWTLPLLTPSNWNFSWARYLNEGGNLDWPLLALNLAFLLGSSWALWHIFTRFDTAGRGSAFWAWFSAIMATTLVVVVMMTAIYSDPRYHGGDDRLQMLKALETQGRMQDVMVLNNHTLVPFVTNYSHSAINWFGLTHETELTNASRMLLDSLAMKYARIWLMLDYSPTQRASRVVENYLTSRVYPVQQQTFSDYAQLVLYSTVAAPDPQHAKQITSARFAGQIELNGFDLSNNRLSEVYTRGSYVQLSLLWKALQSITPDYIVFAQLISSDGRIVWQADRQPVNGARPTSSWAPNELIRDNYGFTVGNDWPDGRFRFIVGLYQWPTLERLPVSGANSFPERYVELGVIDIQ